MKKGKLLGGLAGILLAVAPLKGQSDYNRVIVNPFDEPNATEIAMESNWSKLDSIGKVNYLLDALDKDSTTLDLKNKKCSNYAEEICTNFNGFRNIPISDSLGTQNNGKYNIPTFYAYFNWTSGGGHFGNAVFISSNSNPINSSQWSLFDGSVDLSFPIGGLHMKDMNKITISSLDYDSTKNKFNYTKILEYDVLDGIPSLTDVNYKVLVTESLSKDSIPPAVVFSKEDSLYNPGQSLEVSVSDNNFLDSIKYWIDGNLIESYEVDSATIVSPLSGTSLPVKKRKFNIDLPEEEREHKIEIEVSDIANARYGKTKTKKVFTYTNDYTAPIQNVNLTQIPNTDSALIKISGSDENLKESYCVFNNSEKKYFSSNTSFKAKLEEGKNKLQSVFIDEAGNENLEERVLDVSFKQPSVSVDLKNDKWYNELPLKVNAEIKDADEAYYKINKGEKKNLVDGINSIDAPQGENEIAFYVKNSKSGKEDSVKYEKLKVDTIPPKVNKKINSNELEISVYDDNLSSWDYFTDPVSVTAKSTEIGSPQNNVVLTDLDGRYFVSIDAYDEAGNETHDEGYYDFTNTGIESKVLSDFKVCNLGQGKYDIKYSSSKYGKVYGEIYDLNGKLIENFKDDVFEEGNYEIDLGNKFGMYLINLTDEKGNNYVKKVFNR